MTKRVVLRGSTWLGGLVALLLAGGCGMQAEQEMALDEPGTDEAIPDQPGSARPDQGNPDESGAQEGAAPDDTAEGTNESGSVEEDLNSVMSEDFEGYARGALASPWSVSRSLTSSASIESTSDHGNVFLLQGSPTSGDFLQAILDMSVPSDVVASVDINPDSGAAFFWSVHGTGVSTYKRRIRLQRWPDTTRLVATASPSGDTDCGSLPSGAWSKVTLAVHTATTPSTFDVLINGQATACTGLKAYVTKPFNMVQVMDSSSDGWGGDVRFDNISVSAP